MDGGWLDVYVTDFTHNQWPLYRKSSTTLINLWTPLLGLEDIHQEQIFWACDRVNGEMPPTTLRGDLSQEDLDRVNALRRQMWGRGAQAFGLGGFLGGYGCWSLMRFQQLHPSHALAKALPKLSGKHVVMWTLVDAVLLSYVAVAYAGKKGAVAVRGEFERKQREGVQTDSSFEVKTEVKKPIQVRCMIMPLDRVRCPDEFPQAGAPGIW